jgi:putative transposase
MEQQTVRKTFKYKLMPTLAQQRELVRALLLCRRLYNTALEQRKVAWEWCYISLNRFQQEGEHEDLRASTSCKIWE